jgi:hypothetical protein
VTAGTMSRADHPTVAPALITQDAVALLPSAEIRRVRVRGAGRCALRFLDSSPAHTAPGTPCPAAAIAPRSPHQARAGPSNRAE